MYGSENTVINNFLTFFNGLFIGLFVSGVSFYGFQYFLVDQEERKCFGDECEKDRMIFKNEEYEDVKSSLITVKWTLGFTLIILLVFIIFFYLSQQF